MCNPTFRRKGVSSFFDKTFRNNRIYGFANISVSATLSQYSTLCLNTLQSPHPFPQVITHTACIGPQTKPIDR